MRRLLSPIVLWLLTTLANPVGAVQTLEVHPEETATVFASIDDLNRLGLAGGVRLAGVWGTETEVTLEKDDASGQVFFKPLIEDPFTLYAQDENGATYTLTVVPRKEIRGETILLRVPDPFAGRNERAQPFIERVKRVLREIVRGERPPGYTRQSVNEAVPLWRETTIRRHTVWRGGLLRIEQYDLTNATEQPLVLDERLFRGLSERVRAISLFDHRLAPGASTQLLIVRSAS